MEVERYDPYSDAWSATSPALKYVSNFTATACHGKLYVIGSCAVKYNALTMQCYSPVVGEETAPWPRVATVTGFVCWFVQKAGSASARPSCRGTCRPLAPPAWTESSTWLLTTPRRSSPTTQKKTSGRRCLQTQPVGEGGVGDVCGLSFCCPLQVQHLHALHENGGLVAMEGRLFVTGGHWQGMEGDYSVEVEAYHPPSDTWQLESFLPRLWFYSGVCSVFLDPARRPQLSDPDSA